MEVTRPFAHIIVDSLIVVTKANREKITGYDVFPIKTLLQHIHWNKALLINFLTKDLLKEVRYRLKK